jgi:tetratricopeptide (TPR) repeat protein
MKRLLTSLVVLALFAGPVLAQNNKLEQAVAKAEDQLQKGKPDEALKTVSKAVEGSPSAEGYLALARFQQRLGNMDDAATALAKAKELAASAPPATKAEVLAGAASMALLTGSGKDALAAAKEAVAASPTPAAVAVLARAQARAESAPAALKTAEEAIAKTPNNALLLEAHGEALSAMGRIDDAIAAYRKALEADPKLTLARTRLAFELARQNKGAEAVAEARKATEADPKSGEAFAVLGLALLAQNPKDWNAAIAEAQQGAFLVPKSPMVQVAVGKIFEANGQYDQASAAYQKALESDPGFGAARLSQLQADVARGKVGSTVADLKKLAETMPGSGEAQQLVGEQMLRKGETTEAIPVLEKATQLTPGSGMAWALLGRAYQFNRRYDEAVNAFKKAVELNPANTQYRTDLGLFMGIAGQYDAGVTELKKVTATPGYKDAAAWVNLGWIYRNMKPPKTAESIAAYKKALELDPKEEQSALGLGWAYSYTKSWDESIGAFKKAIEIEPKLAGEAENGIAWAYFFKKDLASAKEHMEKAAQGGRSDTRLKENIERVEKAIAAGQAFSEEEMRKAEQEREKERETYAKYEQANQLVRSKNALQRVSGIRSLCSLAGADCVSTAVFVMQNDPDYGVREQAAIAVGSLGPAAKSAIPNLKACMVQPKYEPPVSGATNEQLEASMKQGDLIRACRDALGKVQK